MSDQPGPPARGFAFDAGETLADRFRRWAGDSPRVYPCAVRAMADDWEAGGPVRELCAGYEHAPHGSVLQLRVLAGVFRLVLTGRADPLRRFYPCLGGTAEPAEIWPTMRTVITEHLDELRLALRTAPQTNEVGRSAALLLGLLDLVDASGRDRIRLLELGASGGLNLLIDRYAISGPGWSYGPMDSPLQLRDAVVGGVPAVRSFTIVDRGGCDLDPIDPASDDGRLLLTSFVWPDDVHRFERLEAAFTVVDQVGASPVDRAPAADWLAAQLAGPAEPGVLTVVWNSITQQYWPAAEITAVRELLQDHGDGGTLGQVSMEFRVDSGSKEYPELRTRFWSGSGTPPRERLLGHAHHHGIPVYLDA